MTTVTPGSVVSFMGLSFETNETVLVPREETEILARAALELLSGLEPSATKVIDMCCGSGNLACALAHARPEIHVWASDLTDACVALARRNVARLELGDRVEIHQGDLFASLEGAQLEGHVDVVVCNPPYISTGKLANESAHLLEGQPREAFDAGPYGFAIHKRVIQEAPAFLRPHGWLVMEIGLGQEKQIEGLFNRTKRYEETRVFRDASGAPRVVAARLQQDRQAE
ncbi:MAG TPA: peptide chain release factor N(5)-glutamine methyltransferase [Labilithrix sp.]|jgi:release factor glutamine methyltransferase|nr:peptide chain release factor N(5)-glutamine methyltransferase [Labilithrix sp.]